MIKLLLLLAGGAKFGKILLTAGTMLISIGAYAMLWGWPFATGFVLLIFAHEMGHVGAAMQRGLPVTAPAFIPFVGAYIQMQRQPASVETEAYVAYAGPFVGTLAAFAVYFWGRNQGSTMLLSLAYSGFVLNLFNLLPISPLDGGRITAVISPKLWLFGIPLLLGLMLDRPSPMLFVIAILAAPHALRAWRQGGNPERFAYYAVSTETKVEYAVLYLGLVVLLALMTYQMHLELAAVRGAG
jgi:Zn-dependent protease